MSAAWVALLMVPALPAGAHEGPPYPILVDQPAGPCIMSVWVDPDVGIGTFFVILDPRPGEALPEEIGVQIAVQPVSGRLPEAKHPAHRQALRNRVQYKAEVPFDAQERWRVRVLLQSARGGGDAATEVEVTPPGLGPFDLVLYLFPFLAVAFLWLRAALRRRRPPTGEKKKPRSPGAQCKKF